MALARFEWDTDKDLENQQKHRVSFAEAQYAFADSHRVIAEDLEHSAKERRSGITVLAAWTGVS